MTKFSDWPTWLQALVLAPHVVLGFTAVWLWWPKSGKEWRKFGFVAAYLLNFLLSDAVRVSRVNQPKRFSRYAYCGGTGSGCSIDFENSSAMYSLVCAILPRSCASLVDNSS
jgi:hypothetical protein